MIHRLLNFSDYFISRKVTNPEQRVRSRMFVVLLLFSVLLGCIMLINLTARGLVETSFALDSLIILAVQAVFLISLKLSKDPEWPSFIYLSAVSVFIFIESAFKVKTILYPNLQVLPLVLVFGFFCLASPYKRIALLAITLLSTVGAIVCLPSMDQFGMTTANSEAVVDQINIATLYKSLLTLFCMAWYVYVKKLAEAELLEDVRSRTQNVRLGEISSSLRALVPELREPLKTLERTIGSHLHTKQLPSEDELRKIESSIERMTKITQSIGWVYRAYRTESVTSTGCQHFQDQLSLLLNGKLHGTPWRLRMKPQNLDCSLSGPMPTVILLILTLVDHVMQTRSQDNEVFLDVEIACGGVHEVYCILSWKDKEGALNLQENRTQNQGNLDLDFRLELIAELVQSCKAKLELAHENFTSTIKISGYWRKH